MIEAQTDLQEIRAEIARQEETVQAAVALTAEQLRATIRAAGEVGLIALALVGAEYAADPHGQL
jgi:hypothetical protein